MELGKYGMEEVELHGAFPTLSPNRGPAPSTKQRAGWKVGQEGPTFPETIPTHMPPHPSLGVGRGSERSLL